MNNFQKSGFLLPKLALPNVLIYRGINILLLFGTKESPQENGGAV